MPVLLNVLLGVPQMLSNIQMILICVAVRTAHPHNLYDPRSPLRDVTQTDVLPALSMCFEPPESGLLSRPPRNVRKDRLANLRLLLHA
jgi:sodium/potassium-transporting ATPase subunit alpha